MLLPDDPAAKAERCAKLAQSTTTEQEADKFRVVVGLLLIGFAFAVAAAWLTIGRL